ncbi:MAG: PQQ-binding-like beta-propeller repeat protein [Planctomycetes bacterium]|nr:PQQ-binding-like beta-propeller repeat protein [Planctomycetota bacterium]
MVHLPRFRSPSAGRTTRAPIFFIALASALILSGCNSLPSASAPPPTSPKAARASISIPDETFSRLGYKRTWTGFAEVGRNTGIRFLETYDDLIIILDNASTVTALEAQTGARRWRNPIGTRLSKFVGIVRFQGRVAVCSETEVFLLDPTTGQTLERQPYAKVVGAAPLQIDSRLVFGTGLGRVFAHSLGSGLTLWENSVQGAIETAGIRVGGAVAFVSITGNIVFIEPTTNSLLGLGHIYAGSSVPLASSNRLLFIASDDQSLYAFSPAGRLPIWRVRTEAPLADAPVHHAGVVYCTIPGRGMTAFVAETGDELWVAPDVGGTVIGMHAGRPVVWDSAVVTLLNNDDGSVHASVELPGVSRLVMDGFTDGTLYAASDMGLVIRLVPNF